MSEKYEGSELAAWFQSQYVSRIRSDLKDYLEAYNQARSKMAEQESDVGEAYLSSTPESLTTRYEVAAPSTARKGRPVELELRLFSGGEAWVVGSYVAHLNKRGQIEEEDLDWCPAETDGVPWPEKPGKSRTPARRKTSLAGFNKGASSFLAFVDNFAEDYWSDREELFDGYDTGSPALGGTIRSRGSSSSEMKTGGGLLKRKAVDSMRKRHADRKSGDINLDDNKEVMSYLLKSPVMDKGRKQYASWFDRLRTSNPEGMASVFKEVAIPVYREMAKNGDVDPEEYWALVNRRALSKGHATLSCDQKVKSPNNMSLDRSGCCSEYKCMKRSISTATGQCRYQDMEHKSRTRKTVVGWD